MENAIQKLTEAILQNTNRVDWVSVASAVFSGLSLIAIVVLLVERKEKKRPYLQVSFELVRSSLVCLVIRNVGEVPARLREITFNKEFVNQLPEGGKRHALDRKDLNISIYPNKQWVICLDTVTSEVVKYKNTKLEISLSYSLKGEKRLYRETELVNFEDYTNFMVYISETDELREELKKLVNSLGKIEKVLNSMIKTNASGMQTQTFSNIGESFTKTLITREEPQIISAKEDNTNE